MTKLKKDDSAMSIKLRELNKTEYNQKIENERLKRGSYKWN